MSRLGGFYPDTERNIPWAIFALQQMSYWQADHPLTPPNFLQILSPNTDSFPCNFLRSFQEKIDQLNYPAHQEQELATAFRLAQIRTQLTEADSLMPPSDREALALWNERRAMMAQFLSIRRRNFAMAHSEAEGVFNDGTGHIELLVTHKQDLERFLAELKHPTWLNKPTGPRNFQSDQAINVAIQGTIPEWNITREVLEKLLKNQKFYLLSSGPIAPLPLHEEHQEEFGKENDILPNYLHATSIQRLAHPSLKQPHIKPLKWNFEITHSLKAGEFRNRFNQDFTAALRDDFDHDYVNSVQESWCHSQLFASEFSKKLTEPIEGSELQKKIITKIENGITQLYRKNLETVSALKKLTEPIADNADKILLFLREKGSWVTKREILRRFTINASTRDKALKALAVRDLTIDEGRHVMVVPLGHMIPRAQPS